MTAASVRPLRWRAPAARFLGLFFSIISPLALIAPVLIAPGVARAENSPAVDKLIQMNKKALEEYESADWDSAKRTLLQALVFAKKTDLDAHAMMARTHVHSGAVH